MTYHSSGKRLQVLLTSLTPTNPLLLAACREIKVIPSKNPNQDFLIVGTDAGLFLSNNGGRSFYRVSSSTCPCCFARGPWGAARGFMN
jgi:hypothetical protein